MRGGNATDGQNEEDGHVRVGDGADRRLDVRERAIPIPEIREFTMADYDAAIALWREADGVTLRDADRRDGIERYLARNPGMSFVAVEAGRVIGTVLAGHDGRRGYLQHVAVAAAWRRRGVGRALVARAVAALEAEGIRKIHLMVVKGNEGAQRFWEAEGWGERRDLLLMSRVGVGAGNA